VRTTAAFAPDPDIIYKKLGTAADCVLRTSNTEYCSDLFGALDDIEAYWKASFARVVPANQKVGYAAPKGFFYYEPSIPLAKIDCNDYNTPGEYCTPAFYDHGVNAIVINEPSLITFHKEKGDLGALVVIAHEWGHHVQNLLGRFSAASYLDGDRFSIQDELQADCYAGAWVAHTEKKGYLEEGDIEEAIRTSFSGGDDVLADWQDEGAHGQAEQRVLAFRSGYSFADPTECRVWETYDGQLVWEFDDFDLAVYPNVTSEDFHKDTSTLVLHTSEARIHVKGRPSLSGGPAGSHFASISRLALGESSKLLESVTVDEKPGPGTLSQLTADRTTYVARRYEQTDSGKTFHGILMLLMRPDGGGISIDVYDGGPADWASWAPLERNLRILILGLSLN
jgi:predicted metalloprotease